MVHPLFWAAGAFTLGIGVVLGWERATGSQPAAPAFVVGVALTALVGTMAGRWGVRPAGRMLLAILCLVCLGSWAAAFQLQWWSGWAKRLSAGDPLVVRGAVLPTGDGRWRLVPSRICVGGAGAHCFAGRLPGLGLSFGSASSATPLGSADSGACAVVTGTLLEPRRAANPGEIDPMLYAWRRGMAGNLGVQALSLCGSKRRFSFAATREAWRTVMTAAVAGEGGAVASAIVLGGSVGEEAARALQRAGLAHVTSVSGLHVGLLIGAVWWLLGGRRAQWGSFVGLLVSLLFVLLTGARAPSIRALSVAAIAALARRRGTSVDPWVALAAAWLFLLVGNPLLLADAGFLLSFSGVAGILALGRPLMLSTGGGGRWWVAWVFNSLAISTAAQAGTAFFTAYYFNQLPILGPLVNLAGVPLATISLLAGLLGSLWEWTRAGLEAGGGFLALFCAWRALAIPGWLLLQVAGQAAGALLWLSRQVAALPWSAALVPSPHWSVGVVWAIAACGIAHGLQAWRLPRPCRLLGMYQACRWLALALALAVLVLAGDWLAGGRRRMSITFFAVGQGDAILLQVPGGRAVLVDAGGRSSSWDASRLLLPQLRRRGIGELVTVVSTHPHADHLGGMAGVIEATRVGWAWDSGADAPTATYAGYRRALATSGTPLRLAQAGDMLRLGGVELRVLWPPASPPRQAPATGDANARSVVLQVTYGHAVVLLLADATVAIQEGLLQEHPTAAVLWKVPHQGAAGSFHRGYVAAIRPAVSVISVGPNRYGHPATEVVAYLQEKGITCRTDLHGAVEFATDGTRWQVRSFRGTGCRARGRVKSDRLL